MVMEGITEEVALEVFLERICQKTKSQQILLIDLVSFYLEVPLGYKIE